MTRAEARHRLRDVATASLAGLAATSAVGVAAADAACPNDAIRAIQLSETLPDCRAFERVTPETKNGANLSLSKTTQSAPAAGAIAYTTSTGIPGSPSNTASGYYRAKREGGEWRVGYFDLPQRNPGLQLPQTTRWIGADLSKSVSASTLPLTPETIPGGTAVYSHDVDSGTLTLLAQNPTDPLTISTLYNEFTDVLRGPVFGATTRLEHVMFDSGADIAPGGIAGASNVWDATGGALTLVSILPDGTTSPTGGFTGTGQNYAPQTPRFMSDDGSRIFFSAPTNPGFLVGALYVRIDATRTQLLSRSVRRGDDPTIPVSDVNFIGASSDGRYAYFTSFQPLTDDAVGVGRWLYRADTVAGTLVRVAGEGTDGSNKLAKRISDDGDRIYFMTKEALLPGLPPTDALHLYLWDRGVLTVVSELAEGDLTAPFAMSDDGRYAEFTSHVSPTGYDRTSAACPDGLGDPGPCAQMYSYDAETGDTTCMSCTPDGGLGNAGGINLGGATVYSPTAVLADGTRIFDTPSGLVPEDTNRKRDVYAWKDGQARLLSSGTDVNDASFLDASKDGTDVYFATFGRLVAADKDSLRDIYTARRDGGLTSQNISLKPPIECALDSCQGQPGGASLSPIIGSIDFSGPGDSPDPEPLPTVNVSGARTVRGSAARVTVRVSAAGRIDAAGTGLQRTTKKVAKSGVYAITLKLTASARKTLARKRRVATTATVTFTSSSGQRKAKVRIVFTSRRRSARRHSARATALETSSAKGGR